MPNPIYSRSKADRTGSSKIVSAADKDIDERYAHIEEDVIALFEDVPAYQLNAAHDDFNQWVYGMSREQWVRFVALLGDTLDRWLVEGGPEQFWFSGYTEDAAHLGAAQSYANLSQLSAAYAASTSLETIIYSAPYRNRLAIASMQNYTEFTSLSAAAKNDLSTIIAQSIADGLNPNSIKTLIGDRLGVSRSRASLYAQTSLPGVLRQTRWAEAQRAGEEMGLRIGLLWTSALKPTTRSWHSSRHGKVYTVQEVRKFYSERGNRFHCYCATTETLLDDDGKPILTDKLKSSMDKEREKWQSDYGE